MAVGSMIKQTWPLGFFVAKPITEVSHCLHFLPVFAVPFQNFNVSG